MPLSAAPAPERRPSPTRSTVSTISRTARSAMTASISTRSKKMTCATLSESCCRTPIFSLATVMENIRYGKLDATDEEVMAAARLANADTFIQQLPNGYDTLLTGDGANLSQGQRQLLAIARAAIADPPVLILDEATSSIDTRTEKIVQDGMDKLMAGRTTFVIAHRLSTVRNSDCIIVLEQGRVIERGSHDQLIRKTRQILSAVYREFSRRLNFRVISSGRLSS